MKVKADGPLDPKDGYESEWVGWDGAMWKARLSGGGPPAVELVGTIVGPEPPARGLLFIGQEALDPAAGRR